MQKKSISLWLVLLVVFLDWVGIGLVYPMFSSMLFGSDYFLLDVSDSTRGWYLGILLSAMPIAQFFSSPILGGLSDQTGRRPVFLFTLVLAALGYFLCMVGVWIKSILLLIGARAIVGIAAGNAGVVNATIVDLSSPATKAKHFGLYSMAYGVGFTIGPFLGGKLSETSFATPFFVAILAILGNLSLIFFLLPETYKKRKHTSISMYKGIRNLKKAFRIPGLRILFLTVLIYCLGWSFFYEFLPVTWIADYHFDSTKIGFFYAYGAGVYALSSGVLIRPIVNRYRHSSVLFYSLLTLGSATLILLIRPPVFWVWIYLPVLNFLVALLFPTSSALVSDWGEEENQGEILGMLQSIKSAAFALSPLAAGFLLGISSHMPMLFGGISILLASLIFGSSLRKQSFIPKKD